MKKIKYEVIDKMIEEINDNVWSDMGYSVEYVVSKHLKDYIEQRPTVYDNQKYFLEELEGCLLIK